MTSSDADPLLALNGLTTVIRTGQKAVPAFVASSSYAENVSGEQSTLSASDGSHQKGTWTVVIGCEQAWWGVKLRDSNLHTILQRYGSDVDRFVTHVTKAWADAMIGWSASPVNASVSKWTTISLRIGIWPEAQETSVKLSLGRLETAKALTLSTGLLLTNANFLQQGTDASELPSRQEVANLQKKLEAAQQALREERHKYRTMLTASPSASGRTKTVYPTTPSRRVRTSHSSTSLLSSPSSHRSSPLKAPGSDEIMPKDEPMFRPSQRNQSLVNPARPFRAPPSQNDDFVGDSDSD